MTTIVKADPIKSSEAPFLRILLYAKFARLLNVCLKNTLDPSRNKNITPHAAKAINMPNKLTKGCVKMKPEKKLKTAKTMMAITVPISPQKKPNTAVVYTV